MPLSQVASHAAEAATEKRRKEIYTGQQTAGVTYSNHCRLMGSSLDMRLSFGVIEDADQHTLTIRQVQHVYMRPESALDLARMICQQFGLTVTEPEPPKE
jgi:hypothetical protein